MKQIDIGITVWPSCSERVQYFFIVVESLKRYLYISEEYNVKLIVSVETDNGTCKSHDLDKWCKENKTIHIRRQGSPDLGANLNEIIRKSTADYIFFLNDDRKLIRRLDLSLGLRLLEEFPKIMSINYCMSPGSAQSMSIFGFFHEFMMPSHSSIWKICDPQLLISRRFIDTVGLFSESCPHGGAEWRMNNRMKKDNLMSLISREIYFNHIGSIKADGSLFGDW